MTRWRVILGAMLVCGFVALAATSAAARSRRCGTFRAEGQTFSATRLRGSVTCRRTRHILRDFFDGKGTMHGPPNGPAYKQWWSVDGWRCGYGAGGGACIHGGKSYKTARDWIEALAKP
jgi:hypothetical protein